MRFEADIVRFELSPLPLSRDGRPNDRSLFGQIRDC